jgi:hypothetical protein
MNRESRKEKAAPDRFEWDKETLKRAGIDVAQGAELAQKLSNLAEQRQVEELNEVWQETQHMSAVWSPYMGSILEKARKKGVDVDGLRALIEQNALEKRSAKQRDRLTEEFSKQRTLILEAISEVIDPRKLERQIRAIVSAKRQGSFTFDSVLAVTAQKEE